MIFALICPCGWNWRRVVTPGRSYEVASPARLDIVDSHEWLGAQRAAKESAAYWARFAREQHEKFAAWIFSLPESPAPGAPGK